MLTEQQKQELRAKYNPEGSPTRLLQLELLDVIKQFDTFCRSNNLKYSLIDGTLLGAVRHQGFIPWDDDMDIMMNRDDYERLLTMVKNDGTIKDSLKLTNDRAVLKLSLGGMFVDLEIVDNVPDNIIFRLIKRYVCVFLVTLIKAKNVLINKRYKKILKWWFVFFPIAACFKRSTLQRWLQFGASKWANKSQSATKAVYINIPSGVGKKVLPCAVYDTISDIQFEGLTLMGLSDYNSFLTKVYGADYNQLPKSIQVHGRVQL